MNEKNWNKQLPLSESACYILLTIAQKACYGYEIVKNVREATNHRITLSNGTLYGALRRMESDEWITHFFQEDHKLYQITPLGIQILKQEKERITELYEQFQRID